MKELQAFCQSTLSPNHNPLNSAFFQSNSFSFCILKFTTIQSHSEVFKSLLSSYSIYIQILVLFLLVLYTWANMEEFYASFSPICKIGVLLVLLVLVPRVGGREINTPKAHRMVPGTQ